MPRCEPNRKFVKKKPYYIGFAVAAKAFVELRNGVGRTQRYDYKCSKKIQKIMETSEKARKKRIGYCCHGPRRREGSGDLSLTPPPPLLLSFFVIATQHSKG